MKNQNKHFSRIYQHIREIYGPEDILLHRPVFAGNEKDYLADCVDSNFVSSVGARVNELERKIEEFTGAKYAVATVNGTAALHIALQLAGVRRGDEVITQALNFVSTCNVLSYLDAQPVFVDVDLDSLSMSPEALRRWLATGVEIRNGACFNRSTGARIVACVPMHTFGLPGRIDQIVSICKEKGISVIEDAAESLGSYVGNRHTGTFGRLAALSFNGNKVITTGGGGMIITDDELLARRAKHLTTTAKLSHPWEFVHDEVGYNYRLPSLNAALGCAQMEKLQKMLEIKADVAGRYAKLCESLGIQFIGPRKGTTSNFWLNTIVLKSRTERDALLQYMNDRGVMVRPIWQLMSHLKMYKHCQNDGLANSSYLEDCVVNLPSSVPNSALEKLS